MARGSAALLSLNLWIVGSVCLVALFWIVSIVVGFVWYPAVGGELSAEPTKSGLASSGAANKPLGFLQLICGGLGLRQYTSLPRPAWTKARHFQRFSLD